MSSNPAIASLQQCRACLGICRHCLESTTPTQPCHTVLPDIIIALEITIALLETKSKHAYNQLCYCADICGANLLKWDTSAHPRCQQSASACRTFLAFWRQQGEMGWGGGFV